MTEPAMTCRRHEPAIGDLLDGGRTAPVEALEAHMATCAACRAVVDDLRRLRDAAQALESPAPAPHVWTRIAAALPPPMADVSGRWRRWQPLAAAAALVLVVSALAWVGGRLAPAAVVPQGPALAEAGAPADAAEARYTDAIAALESAVNASLGRGGAGEVDDALASLRAGLADLDEAAVESRSALIAQPADELARTSLLDALDRKIALLQDTVALLDDVEPAPDTLIQ